ncbi:FUSC family protein, partial [Klebsiella michiganensis]|nr:FUSC family protein [Klebsiella michiganensis]
FCICASGEKLNEIVAELRQLIKEQPADDNFSETPIHGYVWLTIELARQLELLSHLICRALRK